jgi:uncharacterized protein YdeI (YjbR/CyaY-like superfamily)
VDALYARLTRAEARDNASLTLDSRRSPMATTKLPHGEPILSFASLAEWEAWLDAHHASSTGVWLRLARKGSGLASVSKPEALDAALCFGWIDGQGRSADAGTWLQRFTPRGPRSKWSQINVRRVGELAAAGRMRPSGLAAFEAARADGRVERAYAGQRTIGVPDDLQERLDASPAARDFFAALDSKNRYAILYRIQDAKKPETRARRIEKLVAMLEAGQTIH